ncbi:MAG: CHAT domain-containing protein [Roseofilum sp. SBFL]|uniref:CHAT domain-containing protein n=1 Tax=unclassified Roseofilum TaxID=2620099 RepID=UPI001B11379B|nr:MULTISPECIES: CHAT domain-containing protein [unclassified Roseofilum]MBP0014995.1 CHAT domain-containing protein [Roseofilum sp. SID3]MBP0024565.1 CHAT domain-containing protein [Roseofilum sp. SID2]MBP0037279.1 CHAT domain-containing protein [Roseofilum sp. SID1]MBP0041382.1 CHAT domain-containing protein [Roseofilum sp. SBFL]
MVTVRIIQQGDNQGDKYQVAITLEGSEVSQSAAADFEFRIEEQELEDIRWYLEDFLQYPQEPAPKIARRIERRMYEIGTELFEKVFYANKDTRDLWEVLRHKIGDARIEIASQGDSDAATIPWELMRVPYSNTPLALGASAFVRTNFQIKRESQATRYGNSKIKILMVICRPQGSKDVAFRSVATKLIKGLTDGGSEVFQLDVLRPPTYDELEKVLRRAKEDGFPYRIVHFDGHGIYEDLRAKRTGKPPKKKRGYLIFESSDSESGNSPAETLRDREDLVHGQLLGSLLAETEVSLLVLNACRSAYIETPSKPGQTLADNRSSALGSLAQEVINAGVAGVVAMRYNVYVFTAAEFVANLYEALALGQTLGEAVTKGRQQLRAQPIREVALSPLPLQDWTVPIVYEAAPVAFPSSANTLKQAFNLSDNDTPLAGEERRWQSSKTPDAFFLGRDETLLALDRAFDTGRITLLHSYAGSGKTSTAVEFGRWYAQTGGVKGRVLFSSFERYLPLRRVLDEVGVAFEGWLKTRGVRWLALSDSERYSWALLALREVPVLWIWDNVESVAGFPAGTESTWSSQERDELAKFLQEASQTQAKFLLTSRRDERGWLGEEPIRIAIPPMPMQERVQLTRAIAQRLGHQLIEVGDWWPLLQFSQGNPLTIAVLVGQALHDGLKTKQQVENFVARLRTGKAAIEDDEREGRSKSLGVSLSYGFARAFTEEERQQLALLHLFQGFVNVDVLCWMGDPDEDWCVPATRGLTREAGIAKLDRAAEVGLLTARGNGFYTIHPALPWYFKRLFDRYYPASPSVEGEESEATLAIHAYVRAIGDMGDYFYREYDKGKRNVVNLIAAEEANLLHAREVSLARSWWNGIINPMQGLKALYEHTGHHSEWARLVEEIVPEFVDADSDEPLPEREVLWILVTEYRVKVAAARHQWEKAERLQRLSVREARKRAKPSLAAPPESLDGSQRDAIRTLAVALSQLGDILRDLGSPECLIAYEEDYNLSLRIGDREGAAVTAINIRKAYMTVPDLCDLARAETSYLETLTVPGEKDPLKIAGILAQQGQIAYERCKEAIATGQSQEDQLHHLNDALACYQKALNLLPSGALSYLALVHNQLGNIYSIADATYSPLALEHWQKAIRYEEDQGDIYQAARTRFNVALHLLRDNRYSDALLFAEAALSNYEGYGDKALNDVQKTRQLIVLIRHKRGQ